jgi:mitochondrial fission protein ELM1
MTDALHQMTAEFVPVQDRILFRVSTRDRHEYRVWLTRRLVKKLWGVAVRSFEAEPDVKAQAQPHVRNAVMSMKHQQAVQSSDFSQKHEANTTPAPEMTEALLATGVRISRAEKGLVQVVFVTVEGRAVNLNLNEEMLHALCHILQGAADRAGWDLQLSVGDAGVVMRTDANVLH